MCWIGLWRVMEFEREIDMGYMHIDNLYKDQTVLMFRECYALEKIHGTSAYIEWKDSRMLFQSGGAKHASFVALFDEAALKLAFEALGHAQVVVYGEAYGGKQQGQSARYGNSLKFIAFDVRVGDSWLAVPQAEDVAKKLGLEFVHYAKVSTDIAAIDAERDAPSEQAKRNGVDGSPSKEGVVLRPVLEFTTNDGSRVISKHKRDEERETATPRKVVDPSLQDVLTKANEIADEWVTPTRLTHVLDKLEPGIGMEKTKEVIAAMLEDILREARGEIVDSKEARVAIGKKTAILFKAHLQATHHQ